MHSCYSIGDLTIPSTENVTHFLNALNDHHRPRALEELDYLGSCIEKSENIPSPSSVSLSSQSSLTHRPIQAWDKDYITTLLGSAPLTQHTASPSPTQRRITLGTTFQSLSTLFSSLFGLRFRLVDHSAGETWHEDVRKLEVYNEEKNEVVGWIFADLFGREGKASGAAHYTVRCSRRLDWDDWMGDRRYYEDGDEGVLASERMSAESIGGTRVSGKEGVYQLPIAVLSCDFARPSVSGGASMLSYNEVETLYHEMGHALHCMCPPSIPRHLTTTDLHDVQCSHARSDGLSQRLWNPLRHRFRRVPLHPHGTPPFLTVCPIPHPPSRLQPHHPLISLANSNTRPTYCTQRRRTLSNPPLHA